MLVTWGCHEGSWLSRLREHLWTITKPRMESWERTVWEAPWVEDIRLKKLRMQKPEVGKEQADYTHLIQPCKGLRILWFFSWENMYHPQEGTSDGERKDFNPVYLSEPMGFIRNSYKSMGYLGVTTPLKKMTHTVTDNGLQILMVRFCDPFCSNNC